MDVLIISVYRHRRTESDEIDGVVELVGTDKKPAFQSFPGLI
jgi:hypothetical protein